MTVWNVRDERGVLVDDLDRLAQVLGTSVKRAAETLLGDPDLAEAAPTALLVEAKAANKKPGGGTPPPIKSGSFVAWDGGEGRVDLVVSNGKVPGVSEDVEGTGKSPAARVVVYENGKATSKKIGASTHTLRRIPPIKGSREFGKKDARALVQVVSDHDDLCTEMDLPGFSRVTGFAVKSVYERGLDAYPGEAVTALTPEEWALGRVEHFCKVAALDVAPREAGHDVDLLAPEHPLFKPMARPTPPGPTERTDPPEGFVRLDPAAVEAQVKALNDFLAD